MSGPRTTAVHRRGKRAERATPEGYEPAVHATKFPSWPAEIKEAEPATLAALVEATREWDNVHPGVDAHRPGPLVPIHTRKVDPLGSLDRQPPRWQMTLDAGSQAPGGDRGAPHDGANRHQRPPAVSMAGTASTGARLEAHLQGPALALRVGGYSCLGCFVRSVSRGGAHRGVVRAGEPPPWPSGHEWHSAPRSYRNGEYLCGEVF